jgi:uncharacterized repeat protein (TIGR03803 family)
MSFSFTLFTGQPTGASFSRTALCYDGANTLYGTSITGGANNFGCVFSTNLTLSTFNLVYSFTNGNGGSGPGAGLILIGNKLYGTASAGGSATQGTVFSIDITNPNSPVFSTYSLTGNGKSPTCTLLSYNNVLYGTTKSSVSPGGGTGVIFSISPTFTGYTELQTVSDMSTSRGLIEYNGKLYGLTNAAGGSTLYSLNPNGTNFTTLITFTPPTLYGASPAFNTILNLNGVFYFSCGQGGANNNGTVISISPPYNTLGNISVLYTFSASLNNIDGVDPVGKLVYSNNKIYGTCTNGGGPTDSGTLYSMNLDGSNFQVLHTFQSTDGQYPFEPVFVNNAIYGVTASGGVNGNGSMYSYAFPVVPIVPPITPTVSNICFPEKTPIVTDQGIIPIEKINPELHTIRDQKIKAITQTITQDAYLVCFEANSLGKNYPKKTTTISKEHKILYKGKMIKADKFIGRFDNVKPVKYNGEILYNVLMEEYNFVNVNNMICETLHPNNIVAKLYTNHYSNEYKNNVVVLLNECIKKRDYVTYKRLTSGIHF